MGFDFGQIGGIIGSVMDTDEIDIGRAELITLPDGSMAETDANTPRYLKIPCHLSFNTTDNPNAGTAGSIPIIMSITINCNVDVDLQNNDTVWARKLATDGRILEEYKAVIGAPATNQGRKSAIMGVRQGV